MARTATDKLESRNPATGEVLGTVAVASPDDVNAAAAGAASVQKGWGLIPVEDRARAISAAVDDLLDRQDEITDLITRESGKPIAESYMVEIAAAAMELSWVAKHAPRYLAPEKLPDSPLLPLKTHWLVYRPMGVIGIIGPWNYPYMLPASEIAFALASGNGVVFKPSEHTPLIGEEIVRTFERAGVPDGLLRVVHGAGETGAAICAAPDIAAVLFTGSVATGQKVREATAKAGKKVILELGGKDAAIVCADADLDRAVAGTLWAGVANSGQTCAAVERVYVDRRVYDEYVSKLIAAAAKLTPADPLDPDTQIGPMNNEPQYRNVIEQLEDATERGARVEVGGPAEVAGATGSFIAPVVLTNVSHEMKVMTEETFGPLLPVMPFDTEQEAIALANDSRYGLGASVWSKDKARARMLADRLEAGMVWINDHAYSHGVAQAPWGGIKDSGSGVTHSKFGFYDLVEKRTIAEDAGHIPIPWTFPYDEAKRRGFIAAIEGFSRSRLAHRAKSMWKDRSWLLGFAKKLRDARRTKR